MSVILIIIAAILRRCVAPHRQQQLAAPVMHTGAERTSRQALDAG
jgi:hypothetical protein